MPRRSRIRALALTVAFACAAGLAGCGGNEGQGIPGDEAGRILGDLDEVQRRVDANACNDVRRGTMVRLKRRIERLEDVDDDTVATLEDGVETLEQNVEAQCEEQNRPDPTPAPTPEPTPEPAPEEQPQPEEQQPDENPNQGEGDGNGGGQDEGPSVPDPSGGTPPGTGMRSPEGPA